MDKDLLKRHLVTVVVTAVIVIAGFMLSMNRLFPVWCEDKSCLHVLPIKSPIVMMQIENHPLLTDVRDKELNGELDRLADSKIVDLLQGILHPGDRVLEVGAGIGHYSLIMGDAVGTDGKLFIFEPNDDALMLIQANLKINDMWNDSVIINKMPYVSNSTVILEKSIGSLQRYRVLLRRQDASKNTRDIVNIDSIRIDDALKSPTLNLIKLNCYGAEIQVLSGAVQTLQNSPKLAILMAWHPEMMRYYGDIKPFINNMVYLGFEFWSISNNGAKELITKNRLLKEDFDNMLITKNIV